MAKNKEDNNKPDRPLHEIETKCTTCHRRLEQNGEILISEYRRCQTCHLRTCSDCAYVISNIEWLCAKPRCHVLYESRRGDKISDINPSTKSKNENGHRDDSHTKPIPLALDRDRKTDRRGSLDAEYLPKSERPEDSNGASTPAIKVQANGPAHPNGNSSRCIIDRQTIPPSHAGVRPKKPSTLQHVKKSYKEDYHMEYPILNGTYSLAEYFIEHCESVVPRSRRTSYGNKEDDHVSNRAANDGNRERCFDHTISRPHKRAQSCELDSRSLQREIPLKYSHKEYGSSSPHRERGQFNGRRDSHERSFSYHPNDFKRDWHTQQQGSSHSRQLEWKNNSRERDPEYNPSQRSGNPSIETLNEAEFDRKRIPKEKESHHHRSDARASLATSDRPKERSIHRGSSEEYSSSGRRQSSSQSRSDSSRSSSEQKGTLKDKSVDFNLCEGKHTSEKYHQQHGSFHNPDDRSMSKHRQNGSSYMNDRRLYRSKPNEMNRRQRESLIEYHQNKSKSNRPIYNERSHSDEFENERLRSSVYYASENGLSAHHKERSRSSELERRDSRETPFDVRERDKNGKHVRYYQENSLSVQSENRGIVSNFLSVDDCRTEHGLKEIHRERSKSYEIDRVKKYRERSMSDYPNERDVDPIYMQRRSQSVQLEHPSFYRGKEHKNHSDIPNPPFEQKERHLIEKGSRRSSREYLEDYHYNADQSNHRKYLSDGDYSIEYDQQNISSEKRIAYWPSNRNHSQKDNRRNRSPSNNLLLRSFRERPMEYYPRGSAYHYEPKSEKVNQRCNGYKSSVKWSSSHSPRRELIRKSSKHSHLLSVPQHHIRPFFETDMELEDDYKTFNSSRADIYSTFPKEIDQPRQDVYTAEEYQRYNRSRSPKRRDSFEERRDRQQSIDNSDVYDRFYNSYVREFLRQSRPEVEKYEGEACSNYRYSHRNTPGKQVIFCKSNSLENLELTRKSYEHLVTSSSNNHMDPIPVNSSEVIHQNQSRKPFEDAENGYENDILDAIAYLPKRWRSSLGYLAIRIQRCEHSILFTLVGAQGLRHRKHPIAKSVYPRAYAIGCSPPYESNDAYDSAILESTKPYWGIKWKLPLPNDELNGTIFDIYIWDVEFINRAKELQGVASVEIKASNYCDKIQWLPLLESFADNIDRTPSKPTIVNINGTFIALHLHDIQMRLEESLKRGIAKNTPHKLGVLIVGYVPMGIYGNHDTEALLENLKIHRGCLVHGIPGFNLHLKHN